MGLNDVPQAGSQQAATLSNAKANWGSLFDPKQDEQVYFDCPPGGEIGWYNERLPTHPIASFMKLNSDILSGETRNVIFKSMYNKCLNKYHFLDVTNHAFDKLMMYVAGFTAGQTYKLESLTKELEEFKRLYLQTQDHIAQCIKSNFENTDSVKAQTDSTVKALTKLIERVEKYENNDYGDPEYNPTSYQPTTFIPQDVTTVCFVRDGTLTITYKTDETIKLKIDSMRLAGINLELLSKMKQVLLKASLTDIRTLAGKDVTTLFTQLEKTGNTPVDNRICGMIFSMINSLQLDE